MTSLLAPESAIIPENRGLPPGVETVKGFGPETVLQIYNDVTTQLRERIATASKPPELIFPAEGSLLLHYSLFLGPGSSEIDLSKTEVRFAVKHDELTGQNPYQLTPRSYLYSPERPVLIPEDIVDSVSVYGFMEELVTAEREKEWGGDNDVTTLPRPELWAFTRKLSTDESLFEGMKPVQAFPLNDAGDDTWVNSGFGMDSGVFKNKVARKLDKQLALTDSWIDPEGRIETYVDLYAQITALERLAGICLTGLPEGVFPDGLPFGSEDALANILQYRDFLLNNPLQPLLEHEAVLDIRDHSLYKLLFMTGKMTAEQKMKTLPEMHTAITAA